MANLICIHNKASSATIIIGIVLSLTYQKLFKLVADQVIYNHRDCKFKGKIARVILDIPDNGFGEIDIVVLSERHRFMAKSKNKSCIREETYVRILKKRLNTCVVKSVKSEELDSANKSQK